jgi:hypothetical protein
VEQKTFEKQEQCTRIYERHGRLLYEEVKALPHFQQAVAFEYLAVSTTTTWPFCARGRIAPT